MQKTNRFRRYVGQAQEWIEDEIRELRGQPIEQPGGYLHRAQHLARTFQAVPAQLRARKEQITQINESWAQIKADACRQLEPELEGFARAVDSLKATLDPAIPIQQRNGSLSFTDYQAIQAGVQAYKIQYRQTLGRFREIEKRSEQLCKSLRKADDELQALVEKAQDTREHLQTIWRTVSILRRKNYGQDCAAAQDALFPEDLYEEIRQVNARAQQAFSQLEPLITDCQNAIRDAEVAHFEFMTTGDSLVTDFNSTAGKVASYDGQEFSCQELKHSMRITVNGRNRS